MSKKITFLILIVFFISLRLFPIWQNNFPYAYDNAKDSLVLMEMFNFQKPALLGAATSLDGLWQGPFWYYVLLPLNIFLGFHPIASVLTVVILGVFTLGLFWKYLGKLEAFLYAVSTTVIATHQTAWSPYLAMFSTAWVLVIIKLLEKKITSFRLGLLSFCISILFHSEIAFGVVFIVLVISIFIIKKIKLTLKQFFLMFIIFLIPFVPQAVFEIRHSFIQTKSVIHMFSNYRNESFKIQPNSKGIDKISEVSTLLSQNSLDSMLPFRINTLPVVSITITLILLLFLIGIKEEKAKRNIRTIILPVILGSFLLYLFLPLKGFYLIGLTPFWIFALSQLVKGKTALGILLGFFIAGALLSMVISRSIYLSLSENSRILFEPRRQAVEEVYKMAEGQPFASFQYVPEIYDYTYQHIFQYTSIQKNRNVPTEYSYAPGEKSYMQTQKIENLSAKPTFTMLIVELNERPQLLSAWWDKVTTGKEVIGTSKINKSITVYKLSGEKQK